MTFRQEYLAEFVINLKVFSGILKLCGIGLSEPEENRMYVAGADIASAEDFTVITIIDAERTWYTRSDLTRYYPILEARIIGLYENGV